MSSIKELCTLSTILVIHLCSLAALAGVALFVYTSFKPTGNQLRNWWKLAPTWQNRSGKRTRASGSNQRLPPRPPSKFISKTKYENSNSIEDQNTPPPPPPSPAINVTDFNKNMSDDDIEEALSKQNPAFNVKGYIIEITKFASILQVKMCLDHLQDTSVNNPMSKENQFQPKTNPAQKFEKLAQIFGKDEAMQKMEDDIFKDLDSINNYYHQADQEITNWIKTKGQV